MGASASREKFRESVTALVEVDVSPDDADFWDELWKIPSSAEEVFELISPRAARRLRDERFDNLATLFTQATAQLCQIVETPYNIYFDQALNCVRVLTRILPFLLEKGDLGENDENVEHLCWGTGGEDDDDDEGDMVGMTVGISGEDADDDDDDDEDEETVDVDGHVDDEESASPEQRRKNTPRNNKQDAQQQKKQRKRRQRQQQQQQQSGKQQQQQQQQNQSEDEIDAIHTNDDEEDDDHDDDDQITADDGAEGQEPLALLVVHAAMHMLFLPQFTCDYVDDDEYDRDGVGGGSRVGLGGGSGDEYLEELVSRATAEGRDYSVQELAKHKREEQRLLKEDKERRAEAGLITKMVDAGVVLVPRPASIVWTTGAGVPHTKRPHFERNATRKYDKNRIEILRLLLASCCDPLFSPPDEYNPLASRWLAVAVAADAPNAVCLFYSLLNTVMTFEPSGSGMGMPYTTAFASDTHVELAELAAQVLCIFLDCGLPGSPEVVQDPDNNHVVEYEVAARPGFNIFRTLLARIDRGRELTFIYEGFVRLFKHTYESKTSYLPNSMAKLECFQELMILLWKFLDENPMFMPHILTKCDICELVVPICYLMYQGRRDPAQIGLVHICTFVLLKLSGERSFGVSLNTPYNSKLPCDLPLFTGSHADLISITLHKLVVNGAYKLVPLYSCFITVICNISPYWRSMSLVTAVKLVNLFELFSSPRFLYSSEQAYRHLSLLLETFNNMIQYQYAGNQHLVYALIRRKDSFGRLASLTLHRAVSQCNKVYGNHSTIQYDADKDHHHHRHNRSSSSTQRRRAEDDDDDETDVYSEETSTIVSDKSSVAGERFHPTEDWLAELHASLPLETTTRLLQHLVPVVDEICAEKNGIVDEMEILKVLKDITMVGLLPVPHAIVIRKYQPNQYTALWFTAFLWGVIFLRNQNLPIFDGGAIELFQVSVSGHPGDDDDDDDHDDDDDDDDD